jgi:hypothetical protein
MVQFEPMRVRTEFLNATNFRDCVKTQKPPAFSRWYFSFNLEMMGLVIFLDPSTLVVWGFSFGLLSMQQG